MKFRWDFAGGFSRRLEFRLAGEFGENATNNSGVRLGYASTIWSTLIPTASDSKIKATEMRVSRTRGAPPRCCASETIHFFMQAPYSVLNSAQAGKYIDVCCEPENNPFMQPMENQPSISKSKFLSGLQCQKLLWFHYNAKAKIPKPDAGLQAVFDQGHSVDALAKQMFSGGIKVGAGILDLPETIRLTIDAMKLRKPMFEAAFSAGGGYARVDILNPVEGGAWDIIEVKSGTKLEAVHVSDLAFQAWVLTQAGLKIRHCFLCHINNEFVRHGAIDPQDFFTLEDITAQVSAMSREIEEGLAAMQRVIGLKAHPEIQIGKQCTKPYTCPLYDRCWSLLPEDSVFTLYNDRNRKYKLFAQGIHHLKDIPTDTVLTDNQSIQRATLLAGRPHIDRPALAGFLKQLEYPISFLDFETFNEAIPRFDDSRPFQQIPFQFSLHILRSPNSQPEHRQFLAEGTADPRPEFMRQLRDALPATGSVVTYNASFEKNCMKEGCQLLPKFKPWFKKVERRVVDLLLPFRGFRYYHPQQHGSASMKAVLPALTGKGYENLAIQEGGTASREFMRVTFGDVSKPERSKVRKQLEDYCGLDTMGMVQIVAELSSIALAGGAK